MHNGLIRGYPTIKRDLALAVEPALHQEILGSTDSKMFFYLALTFGRKEDVRAAVAAAVDFMEKRGDVMALKIRCR